MWDVMEKKFGLSVLWNAPQVQGDLYRCLQYSFLSLDSPYLLFLSHLWRTYKFRLFVTCIWSTLVPDEWATVTISFRGM